MKRKTKKLALSRETLRHLQANELRRAAGGACTQEFITTCQCTEGSCDSCTAGTATVTCGTCQSDGCCQSETYEILSGCASNC